MSRLYKAEAAARIGGGAAAVLGAGSKRILAKEVEYSKEKLTLALSRELIEVLLIGDVDLTSFSTSLTVTTARIRLRNDVLLRLLLLVCSGR